MNFDNLVKRVLQESNAIALPAVVQRIIPEILDWMKGFCIDRLWQSNVAVLDVDKIVDDQLYGPDYSFDNKQELKLKLLNTQQHQFTVGAHWEPSELTTADDVHKDYINLNKDIIIELWTQHTNRAGDAATHSNTIRLFLPIADANDKHISNYRNIDQLKRTIVHELTHLYDPTLNTSNRNLDRASDDAQRYLERDKQGESERIAGDTKWYYTHPGYRAGKIPIEFYPNLRTMLDATSITALKRFLYNQQIGYLDGVSTDFVIQTLEDPYLKRKFLEKIAQYVSVNTKQTNKSMQQQLQQAKPGDVFAWSSNSSSDVIHKLDDTLNELDMWHNWNDYYNDDDAFVEEFNDYESFKENALSYIDNFLFNITNIEALKVLEHFKGKYKFMCDQENAEVMFGKEIY